jgi:SAM-dependent methyltransferase
MTGPLATPADLINLLATPNATPGRPVRGTASRVSVHDMAGERAMSFGAIAEDYDRLRSPPPQAAIDWLVPESCRLAVDLAAGTGLLSRALAGKVARVVAVEPDDRMAAVLRTRSPGVRVVRGVGESLPIRDASADGVFISSAWHWLDPRLAAPEIGRVLRDGGRLGLIWTSRDREVDWIRQIDGLRETGASDSGVHQTRESRFRNREASLPEDGIFWRVSTESFTFTRTMTVDDLVGMLGTYSGLLVASQAEREASLRRVRTALERRFHGMVDVPMRSWCWRADRVPR